MTKSLNCRFDRKNKILKGEIPKMGDTLLSYAVSANQSPIQVSPETGDPSIVNLMIVVSNSY